MSKAPAALARSAQSSFDSHLRVQVMAIAKLRTKAVLPGEVSAPGVAITLSFQNSSNSVVDLHNVLVGLVDSHGTPGASISGAPARTVAGTLAAHHTASGVYVFNFPQNSTSPLTVTVSYSAQAPVLRFRGDL